MSVETKFQSIPLSRLDRPEDFKVYRAALEWDLTDPIVIESKDDFRSTPRWREKLNPYYHQVTNLITFCRRLPVTLLADDVGLGKTISAGLIISELAARTRVQQILIVCPKLLCPQWKEELKSKFDIQASIAIGRQLLHDPGEEFGAVVTTYNTARLYLERLPEDRFQMLILDEAHKLRNLYGVPNTPQVAKKFHKALQDRRFRFVLMLTATPIQNRLWDLYSLVDLLTVARGHQNPFGAPGMFARKFIADDRDQARQLKAEAREEFRSIVYGYMSRVRRGDARLAFPSRVVQMHAIKPSPAELELIEVIREPIQKMNRLAQISILQALASSPDALSAQLTNMARKGTAPGPLAAAVKGIVTAMPPSAKLVGLGKLIESLKQQNPDSWRLVVFTTRRETQTTIQAFLESHGLRVGLINGDSGERNQETIARFKATPPDYRVIVSTEAGSEGVNLQVANVLVNFDLPWNPMIVEQRIGRIQRLASVHEKVSIFNVMLSGTFEEYIVGRLMQKLQMAAHAIGDIEALLQGSDVDGDGEGDSASSFEDRVLDLVLAALAKRDVEKDVALAVQSIEDARRELEREEANINALLGGMDGTDYVGPRAPRLPIPIRSMSAPVFTVAAFEMLGAHVREEAPGLYFARGKDVQERFRTDAASATAPGAILYTPDSPAFQRLVKRCIASGLHNLRDLDEDPQNEAERIAREWAWGLGAIVRAASPVRVIKRFEGDAVVRVRATVAHDAYERLISIRSEGGQAKAESAGTEGLSPAARIVRDPKAVGLDPEQLVQKALDDDAVSEFCRFYEERRTLEVRAAGDDPRKRKKLEDEFTPRIDVSLVGIDGTLRRDVVMRIEYGFQSGGSYVSEISTRPGAGEVVGSPATDFCSKSGAIVPKECLAPCDATGAMVLKHFLQSSELSDRRALPEFVGTCSYTGKRALQDELEPSQVTGKLVASSVMKTSALSGRRAEPTQFGRCAFTNAEVLSTELDVSQISGKAYRSDEQSRSAVSGRTGHKSEFIACHETRQILASDEAETCDVSGAKVRPGLLETCEVTRKQALPSLLATCAGTGKKALKSLMVSSSISGLPVLRGEGIVSSSGAYCLRKEAEECLWAGQRAHPEDIRECALTGLRVHTDHLTRDATPRLRVLAELLDGIRRTADEEAMWPELAERVARAADVGKCRIEAAALSPSKRQLAVCAESKSLLGLRVHKVGAVYDLSDRGVMGRVTEGKRSGNRWAAR